MTTSPIRVVIDTNVFIRYLIRPSAAIRRLIEELWLEDHIAICISAELFDELAGVLEREKMREFIQPQECQALLDVLQVKAEFTPSLGKIPALTRDPKDDMFVACAITAQATHVITDDRDLLALGEIFGFQILTPYAFVQSI